MTDIVDELAPDNHRMVDGVATPHVEVPNALLERAIAEINRLRHIYECENETSKRVILENLRLRSLAGKADVGPSFAEIAKDLPRRSTEPSDPSNV